MAADLIKTDIKAMSSNTEYYPSIEDIKGSSIPESFKTFIGFFTGSSLKKENLGQCLMKLVSSSYLPPLMFGLSVEVDSLFGSR